MNPNAPRHSSWSLLARLAPAAAAVVLLACAGKPPSTVPLGVGPLPPGAKLTAELRLAAKQRSRQQRPHAEPAASAEEEPDEATPEPIASATPAAKDEKKPVAPEGPAKLAAPADPSGEYRGNDVSSYRLSEMPDRTEKDANARVAVKKKDTKFDFVLIDSSNGKDICTLKGSVEGQGATILPGQACFEQDGEGSAAQATVTRGTASFEKDRLVLDLTLDFELRLGDDDHSGTLEYHFDGTRR